jgi:hypothetical protein
LLTDTSKEVVRRTFVRNLGQADFNGILWLNGQVPSNRIYRLEISPSSKKREGFLPLYVNLLLEPIGGKYAPYRTPFTLWRNIGITVVLVGNFLFVGFRIYGLAKKKETKGEKDENVPFRGKERVRGRVSHETILLPGQP